MKTNEKLTLDRNLLKNHLYSTFILPQTIEQKDMINGNVIHEITITTKILNHKTDIALHLEIDFVMTKALPHPQYTQSRYDNYKKDSRSYRSPYRSSCRSPYRHDSRHRHRSRSYSRDNNNFTRYTSSYCPPSRPRDSRYSGSRSHSNTRNKVNTINHNTQMIQSFLKYTCTIQVNWQTL